MAMKLIIPACMVLASVACHRTPQAAPTMPYAAPGVHFQLAPVPGDCSRATVSWDVPEDLAQKPEVQIDRTARTVFTRSNDRKSHEDTGPWVRPGLEFYLLDRTSGDVLAATQASGRLLRGRTRPLSGGGIEPALDLDAVARAQERLCSAHATL